MEFVSLMARRMDMNRVSAFINAKLLSSSMISIWTALDVRQLKSTTPLFECASPSRVLHATMFHRPKTSTPTILIGGDGATLSAVTHLCITELINFLAPTIQEIMRSYDIFCEHSSLVLYLLMKSSD